MGGAFAAKIPVEGKAVVGKQPYERIGAVKQQMLGRAHGVP